MNRDQLHLQMKVDAIHGAGVTGASCLFIIKIEKT